jgi:hypothetical protein
MANFPKGNKLKSHSVLPDREDLGTEYVGDEHHKMVTFLVNSLSIPNANAVAIVGQIGSGYLLFPQSLRQQC